MTTPAPLSVARADSTRGSDAKEFVFADGRSTPTTALTYAPASVVTVGNAKFVHISGHTGVDDQTPVDQDEQSLARALGAQTSSILTKIRTTLADLDGTLADIVRVRVYVRTELTQSAFEAIHAARRIHFHGDRMPASTLVRVAGLVRPSALIEIDADAVIVDR